MRTPLKSRAIGTFLDKLLKRVAPLIIHWALGLTILSAVAEFWTLGHPAAGNVSWGDWSHFVAYTAMVNSFLPSNWTDALAVAVTAAEILLGIGLILGIYPRLVSLASAGLLSLFAFSMTLSFGIKAPLNFSVCADAAASLLLSIWPQSANAPAKIDQL